MKNTLLLVITFILAAGSATHQTSAQDISSSSYKSPTNPFASSGLTGQCTWFTFGRALEKTGVKVSFRSHGKTWTYDQGFGTGPEPRENSIISWSGGAYGHVAFVERVNTDGSIVITEANFGAGSYYQIYNNGSPRSSTGYHITLTRSQWQKRGSYSVNGFVYLKRNLAPNLTISSAGCDSQGNLTTYFNVSDPDGDSISSLDAWIITGSGITSTNGVSGTAQFFTFPTSGARSVKWTNDQLRSKMVSGSTYSVALRALDSKGAKTETTRYFQFVSPTTQTNPEIAILSGVNEISSGSNTGVGNVNVQSSDYRTYTVSNTGNGTLSIGSLSIGNTTDFSVDSYPASRLAAGQKTSFTIRFSPRTAGSKTCTVSLVNTDSNENPYRFTLSGTGSGNSASTNAMDRFATSNSGWLGSYTGQTWQDSHYVYRRYSSGNHLANRIGTNEVWYQWSGRWYNGGTW